MALDTFEQSMATGVEQQQLGAHDNALQQRLDAWYAAPYGSLEEGRALRDVSASYDKLGDYEQSFAWAVDAYQTHDNLIEARRDNGKTLATPAEYRERAMSAIYVAIAGYRLGLADNKPLAQDMTMLDFAERCRSDLLVTRHMLPRENSSWIDRLVDQYDINALRRISIVRSLAGHWLDGLGAGLLATAVAPLSESPRLATSNPSLRPEQRLKAKAKALTGAAAALAVNTLTLTTNDIAWQQARRITDHVI